MTLYQGLGASMIGVSHPLIYFPLYEKSKIYLKESWDTDNPDPNKLSTRYILISAVTCKAITSAITYPHEVLRARLQDFRKYENTQSKTQSSSKPTILSTCRQLLSEKGVISFYDGFWVNLMRITPSYAITFVLYENFSVILQRAFNNNKKTNED